MFSLTTPSGNELNSEQVTAARDAIKSTIDSQMSTFPGGVRELLIRELGAKGYERLINDLSNNVTQGLL